MIALNAPSMIVFLISLLPATLALLVGLGVRLPGNNAHAVYVALVAYFILALGVLL